MTASRNCSLSRPPPGPGRTPPLLYSVGQGSHRLLWVRGKGLSVGGMSIHCRGEVEPSAKLLKQPASDRRLLFFPWAPTAHISIHSELSLCCAQGPGPCPPGAQENGPCSLQNDVNGQGTQARRSCRRLRGSEKGNRAPAWGGAGRPLSRIAKAAALTAGSRVQQAILGCLLRAT